MSEEEMQKRLYESLEEDDFCQLKLPLEKEDKGSLASYSRSDGHSGTSSLCQSDFLTHKINKTKD